MNRPPQRVISALGFSGEPEPFAGGQGTSWRVGDAVLKPLDLSGDELAWRADLNGRLADGRFRIPQVLRTRDGSLAVDGWFAQGWLAGTHERRWAEILAAGEAFLDAVAGEPRPSFLDARMDPWAVADRVAWDEGPAGVALDGLLERLIAVRRPIAASSQLIHGDLATNVLFSEGEAPAIIDLSPYWRPAGYQSALVVVDALTWEGADGSILSLVSHIDELGQLLVRALIFEIASHRLVAASRGLARDDPAPFARTVELIVSRLPFVS